ncbi:MAG: hypothetical protein Fur003_0360 [Candidatus Dojkabacteria bacterium]
MKNLKIKNVNNAESRYFIINKEGEIIDIKKFIKSKECSAELAQFIKLELKDGDP